MESKSIEDNFHDVCEQIKSMLENTTDPVKQNQIIEDNMIKKVFDLLDSQKTTGKNKLRRRDIDSENQRMGSFLVLFKQIHETKNQDLIDQIIEHKICDALVESLSEKTINKYGKYTDLYIETMIDMFLINNTIGIIIDIYCHCCLVLLRKICYNSYLHYLAEPSPSMNKYRIFVNLLSLIQNLINKSPQTMCKKYWNTSLINLLSKIYCCSTEDDLDTKMGCFHIVKIFVDNSYCDQRVVEFLINCLCMKEADSICGPRDCDFYYYIVSSVCVIVNQLLEKYKDSETEQLFITKIKKHWILDNLEDLVNKKFYFSQNDYFDDITDNPKKLIDRIKKLVPVSDSETDDIFY